MKYKFDTLFEKYFSSLDEEKINKKEKENDGDPFNDAPESKLPDEDEVIQEPEQATLTPEGKRYLIDLIVQALSIDPKIMSSADSSIFSQEVTGENADELLSQLKSIIDSYTAE